MIPVWKRGLGSFEWIPPLKSRVGCSIALCSWCTQTHNKRAKAMCNNGFSAPNSHWIFNCNQIPKYIHESSSNCSYVHKWDGPKLSFKKAENCLQIAASKSCMYVLHLPQKFLRKRKSLTKEIDISNEERWRYWWYAFGQEKEVLHHLSVCLRHLAWSTGKKCQRTFITILHDTFHFSWKWSEGNHSYPFQS